MKCFVFFLLQLGVISFSFTETTMIEPTICLACRLWLAWRTHLVENFSKGFVDGFFYHLVGGSQVEVLPTPATALIVNYDTCKKKKNKKKASSFVSLLISATWHFLWSNHSPFHYIWVEEISFQLLNSILHLAVSLVRNKIAHVELNG